MTTAVPSAAVAIPPPQPANRPVRQVAGVVTLAVVVVAAVWAGWHVRRWHWELTRPIHFVMDMNNPLQWGRRTARLGYLNVYDNVVRDNAPGKYQLDYPPLRLLVMTQWAEWVDRTRPGLVAWSPDYAVNRPLLLFNTAMELASAALAFALVRRCRVRAGRRFATVLGLAAAGLIWFNPQILISTWGRPAWEVWVVPFYLATVYLAAGDEWLAAGAVLGVGMMFKGQLAIVSPVFVLWPLMAGRPLAAVRWTAGFAVAAAVVVAPWMVTRPVTSPDAIVRVADGPAIAWVSLVAAATTLLLTIRMLPARVHPRAPDVAAAVVGLAVAWPMALAADHGLWRALLPAAVAVAAVLRFASLRAMPTVAALGVAAALLACTKVFHGGTDWLRVGFLYGAAKFPGLDVGGSDSLAGILSTRYHLFSHDVAFAIGTHRLTVARLMWVVYALALAAAARGLAHLHARRDPRWLLAIATPWVAYFAVAPQMHERYLLWGAAAASLAAGVSVGTVLLAVVLSAVSWANTLQMLLWEGDRRALSPAWCPHLGERLTTVLGGTYPDVGWAVLLIAGIFVFESLRPAPAVVAADRPATPA